MCHAGLMLTNGEELQWLTADDLWSHPGPPNGEIRFFDGLSEDAINSDELNEDNTVRSTTFAMDLANIDVSLVQETPATGFNYIQTYTFSNSQPDPVSLDLVWFADPDLEFEQSFAQNRVGFHTGQTPMAYVIEESDVGGPGHPGVADRSRRMSMAANLGDGVTFDGFLGIAPPDFGGFDLVFYLQDKLGILDEDLNTIQQLTFDFGPNGNSLDTDGDCMMDTPGDVGAAMQFSLDIPAEGSASLQLHYVGGNLSNSVSEINVDVDACSTHEVGGSDLDKLVFAIRTGDQDPVFDYTGDGQVDFDDLQLFVTSADYMNSYIGDSNIDGEFNSRDFVLVFAAGQYEDNIPENSKWNTGDWNADGEFDTSDFVVAFTDGGYEKGPRAAAVAVPEPNGLLLLFGCAFAAYLWKRR